LSISALDKRPERISVDLELVYPQEEDGNNELCFEELRAKSRGLYDLDWNAQRDADRGRHTQLRQPLEGSRTPIKVKTILSPSPKKGKIRRKGQGRAASPTMTFHTKAATDEIYGIFNQPLKTPAKTRDGGDSEESDFGDDSEGDYTTASMVDNSGRQENPAEDDGDVESVHSDWSDFHLAKSMREPDGEPQDDQDDNDTFAGSHLAIATNKMEKLSVFTDGQEPPKVKATARKLQIPSPPEDFDPPTLPYYQAKDQSHMQSRLPYMTPIVERTEFLPATIARKALQAAKTPSRGAMPVIDDDDDFMGGSPFNDVVNKAPPPLDLLRKKPAVAAGKESSIKRNPIIDDTVCNPVDESMRAMIYNKLHPPLKSYEGYYEYSSIVSGKASEIKKFTKAMAKRDGGLIGSIPDTPLLEFVTGQGGSSYTVRRELGKGAYAPVYLVENNTVGDAEDELEEGALDTSEFNQIVCGRKRLEALKMEHPPSAWEFYMLKQAHIRLRDHRAAESIVRAYEMHQFKDEGFLLIEYRDQGTILDLVNIAKTKSEPGVMDEILVMFFSIELLRTLEGLHAQGLIHGDIKPDNCLVRFDPIPDNEWSSKYQTDGSGGWSKKGVTFIDFGRGIDMTLFRPDVQFIADWKTDQQDCAEMREMRPWTYQVDYHGVAAIIHSMLYGKYIQTVAERSGLPGGGQKNYRLTAPFRRYWQKDIWSTLFDVLLNPLQHVAPEDGGALPITTAVRKCRQRMEGHVLANCDKGVGLKSMIRKLEVTVNKRK
jgi:checkpoint serine/threonine-protein kinase